jgi:hypothetical protein
LNLFTAVPNQDVSELLRWNAWEQFLGYGRDWNRCRALQSEIVDRADYSGFVQLVRQVEGSRGVQLLN